MKVLRANKYGIGIKTNNNRKLYLSEPILTYLSYLTNEKGYLIDKVVIDLIEVLYNHRKQLGIKIKEEVLP